MRLSVIRPRAFDHWRLDLGFKQRAKIQAWQYGKYVSGKETRDRLEVKINDSFEAGYKKLALVLPIMVIDDAEQLLPIIEKRLRSAGFNNIVTFSNPEKALAAYRARPDKPQIIITDYSMPEMLGHELIEKIAAVDSGLSPRFIIFSGDARLTDADHPAARVIAQHQASVVVKGPDFAYLAGITKQLALQKVKGLAPMIVTLDHPPEVDSTIKNSFAYQFMGRVVHKINNILGGLGFFDLLSDDYITTLKDQRPLDEGFIETRDKLAGYIDVLIEYFDHLATFAKLIKFDWSLPIHQTGLPEELLKDKWTEENWNLISPGQRAKLPLIVDQYIKKGFGPFIDELKLIRSRLFADDINNAPSINTDYSKIFSDYSKLAERLKVLNDAAMLYKNGDPDLLILFNNYYRIVAGIDEINS